MKLMTGLFDRFHSIYGKLLLSSCLTSILPVLLVGVVLLPTYRGNLYRQVSGASLTTVEQNGAMVENVLEQVVYYSSIYFANSDINSILRKKAPLSSFEELQDTKAVGAIFTSNTYIWGELRYYISIIGANGAAFSSADGALPAFEELRGEPWYPRLEGGGGSMEWINNADGRLSPYAGESSSFAAARPIMHPYDGTVLGVMLVVPHERTLGRIAAAAGEQFDQFYIVDGAGDLVYSSNPDHRGISPRLFREKMADNLQGYFPAKVDGVDSLVAFCTVRPAGWKVVGVVANRTLYAPIDKLMLAITGLLFLYILTILTLSRVVNRQISLPIRQLDQEMQAVSLDNLEVRSRIESRDEIGNLADSFNGMVARLKTLLGEYEAGQEARRRAEIQALQAQIKPHFLYNTLASVRFMLKTRPNEETDRVLQSLVQLLKGTITARGELHRVGDEVGLLRDYVRIMQARNPNFAVEYQVEKEVEALPVIKLLLQPLVENSIYHGFHQMDAGGMIRLEARREGQALRIAVEDNGPGMTPEEMAGVFARPGGEHAGGIRNVHDRIVAHYGPGYGLELERGEMGGLRCVLRLPVGKLEFEKEGRRADTGG